MQITIYYFLIWESENVHLELCYLKKLIINLML